MALSDFLPVAADLFGSLTAAGGSLMAGSAAAKSGARIKSADDFEAAQLDQNAGQSIAAGQRAAIEARRQAALVQSRILAVAAASGGGALDPTVVRLIGQQAGEGEFRARTALYQGEERARAQRMAATTKRYEGDLAEESGALKKTAYDIGAASALFKGSSTLYSRYGMSPHKSESKDWQGGDDWY